MKAASVALIVAEVAVVLSLLVPGFSALGGVLAAALLLLYAAAMAAAMRAGRPHVECGCGGAPQPLSATLIGRNAVLAAIACLAVLAEPAALDVGEVSAALAGGFALFVFYLLADQILANAAMVRLRP